MQRNFNDSKPSVEATNDGTPPVWQPAAKSGTGC